MSNVTHHPMPKTTVDKMLRPSPGRRRKRRHRGRGKNWKAKRVAAD